MFGRRPDATLVTNTPAMRRIMPHVSPRRNDSVFHLRQQIEVEAALEFVEKHNRTRPPERPATLFHCFLRSCSQVLVLRPGVNRFVKGRRLWQRDGEWMTFSAKREMADGADLLTIKRRFDARTETFDEMVDGIYDRLRPARAGVKSTSEKETALLLRLPVFATGLLIRAADLLDHFGLLPKSLIEPDPLYCSGFIANLGSVGLDAGWHHVWERGTCSIFGVVGRIKPGPEGRRVMDACWTYDERIEDGLYAFHTLDDIKGRVERPEELLLGTEELAALG